MDSLVWTDDKYSLGIQEIDDQHRQLFKLINELNKMFEAGDTDSCISEAIVELVKYSETHFSTEERHMTNTSYTRINEHKQRHNEFRKKIKSYLLALKREDGLSYRSILAFLLEWVDNHIKTEDKSYGTCYSKIREKSAATS